MKYMVLDFKNVFYIAHVHWASKNPNEGNNRVILSFLMIIARYISRLDVDMLIIATEGIPEYRHAILGDYKDGRDKPRTDKWIHFKRQQKLIQKIIDKLFPCIVLKHSRLEADDRIYESVCCLKKIASQDDEIIVVSSDKDMLQMLDFKDPRIKIWSPQKKSFQDTPKFDYLTMKALMGDKSDNISGIYGIGPKKAEKIAINGIEQYLEEHPYHRELFDRNIHLMKLKRWNEIPGVAVVKKSSWEFNQMRFETIMKSLGINNKKIDDLIDVYSKMKVSDAFVDKIKETPVPILEEEYSKDASFDIRQDKEL